MHNHRSNAELQGEGPDPDFEAAINENCVAIAKKEAMVADLLKQLEQIEGVCWEGGGGGGVGG